MFIFIPFNTDLSNIDNTKTNLNSATSFMFQISRLPSAVAFFKESKHKSRYLYRHLFSLESVSISDVLPFVWLRQKLFPNFIKGRPGLWDSMTFWTSSPLNSPEIPEQF